MFMHYLLIGANHVSLGCSSHPRCYIIKETSLHLDTLTRPLADRLALLAADGAPAPTAFAGVMSALDDLNLRHSLDTAASDEHHYRIKR